MAAVTELPPRRSPGPLRSPTVPHNHDRPGWDRLDARPLHQPADGTRPQVVVISDDVPRTYAVETWDPPYGPGDYATGLVVDRLAAIVAALQHPERLVRITRLDPPATPPKPPPADPNVWPAPVMVDRDRRRRRRRYRQRS